MQIGATLRFNDVHPQALVRQQLRARLARRVAQHGVKAHAVE
jgi:hypothetical protein